MKSRKKKFNELKNSTATALLFSVGLVSSFASAQEADKNESSEEKTAQKLVIEEVFVTGSRIKRPGVDTVRPSVGISAELIEKRAFTNIADAIGEVPLFSAGLNPNGDQEETNIGQNFVNLFGLGTQRTLTLVNGRRFVSSNPPAIRGPASGLQVDFNSLPAPLVKSIEIVPLAGAAIYGSDAIAGTVNVILRDDYEGFEVGAQYGVTEQGDGETFQVFSTIGTNFAEDRGNIVFSVELNRQSGMLTSARPRFTNNQPRFIDFGAQDLNGDGVNEDLNGDGRDDRFSRIVELDDVVQSFSAGGTVSEVGAFIFPVPGIGALSDGNFYQFNPDSTLSACTPGQADPVVPVSPFVLGGTCGSDFADEIAQLRSPLERVVITSISHYDITENIRFEQEFMFANSQAVELANQGDLQTPFFSGTGGALTFSIDNPFLTDQARSVLTDNGLEEFSLHRINRDLLNGSQASLENSTWRYAAGLSGQFFAFGRDFFWDVSTVFGQSDVESQRELLADGRFLNAINAVELTAESLAPISTRDLDGNGVIDANDGLQNLIANGNSGVAGLQLGSIVCQANIDKVAGTLTGANQQVSGSGVTSTAFPFVNGCQPLNLFGEDAASQGAREFAIGGPLITTSDIGQRVFTANFGGTAVELPAGALSFVAGFESRRETAVFTPSIGDVIQLTRFASTLPVSGELETIEFYGETLIPVASPDMGVPFVELLELQGSIRNISNKVTGPDGTSNSVNSTVWETNGRWSPVRDITFRASYSNAIRSPSIVELFTPATPSVVSGGDPCDRRLVDLGLVPDTRRANCIAAGITDPDNFTSGIVDLGIQGFTSGNPALQPETSTSFSIGALIQPRWIDNLTMTIDYFNIEVSNQITQLGFGDLSQLCFDSTNFPNDGACNLFTRDQATSQITSARTASFNASVTFFEALNYHIDYGFDVASAFSVFSDRFSDSDFGIMELSLNVLQNLENGTSVLPTVPANPTIGTFSRPDIQGTFDVTYNKGPFTAFWRVNFQNGALFDISGARLFLNDDSEVVERSDPFLNHNVSFAYEIFEGTSLQLSINNALDRKPSRIEQARGFFGQNEILGRTFNLRIRSRF